MAYRLPNINAGNPAEQIRQMHSYLRQLVTDMNMNLEAEEEASANQEKEKEEKSFSVIQCYPVGSVYISVNDVSPQTLFGGRWEQMKDRFLLAAGDVYKAGSLGGSSTVKLTADQIPSHTHTISYNSLEVKTGNTDAKYPSVIPGQKQQLTSSTGKGEAHDNMPPYIAVYVWVRVH